MTTKKEKLFINIVLVVFIAGIICCFTLYPFLSEHVFAEELSNNSVLNFNQLVNNISSNNSSLSVSNYSVSINSDITSNGFVVYFDSVNLISGHVYYVQGLPNCRLFTREGSAVFDDLGTFIATYVRTYSSAGAFFYHSSYGSSVPTGTYSLMICDLTQCFGSGNEPTTINEFKSYFNNDYYFYTLSTLVPLDATTSYSQGYTDGIQSFSVVTAADDIYNSSYYSGGEPTDTLVVNDTAPYFQKLVYQTQTDLPDVYLIFPMINTIPANSNFSINGYINSYVYDTSGTLNIYAFINNKDYISLGSISFSGTTPKVFNINVNVPFSVSNIAFISTNSLCVLGDVSITYKISNLQKLAQDNYDAGRASRDSDVTIAFENGKKVGMSQANPYTFNALFGAVFDAPIKALTGLLDFDILGVNMKGLYLSLFTLALIIFVVKLCLGKV